jgi:proteasome component ECM29
MVQSFSLIYLEMGFQRATSQELLSLIPRLLLNVSQRPHAQQSLLFTIALPHFQLFNHALDKQDPFQFISNSNDLNFLLNNFQKVIMYSCPSSKTIINALNAAALNALPAPSPLEQLPSGLCKADINFITNNLKAPWIRNISMLKDLKVGLLKFLSTEELIGKDLALSEKFQICTIALSDASHEVQFLGDSGLKRFPKPDFEDESLIRKLYFLYQGTPQGKKGDETRTPAGSLLKQKLLETFQRSTLAANLLPQMIQVAFDSLYGPNNLPKVRMAGMGFIQWVAKMAREEILLPVGGPLLSGLLKLIDEDASSSTEQLRGFSYEAIGLLAKRGNFFKLS